MRLNRRARMNYSWEAGAEHLAMNQPLSDYLLRLIQIKTAKAIAWRIEKQRMWNEGRPISKRAARLWFNSQSVQ